jgi:serine/threonine-protein kinase
LNPNVPRAWSDATMRGLAKRPEERFESAADFARALRSALSERKPTSGRATTPFEASIASGDGREDFRARCKQLTKGGMFLDFDGPPPPLRQRLKVTLEVRGSRFVCLCEVVQHVTAEQASRWGSETGFGVQFVDVSLAFQEQLARVLSGSPADSPTEDPALRERIEHYRWRLSGDLYRMAAVAPDADFPEIRRCARESRTELVHLLEQPLVSEHSQLLEKALDRLKQATMVLSNPERRAEHDAQAGNVAGIRRCLSAGLTASALERLCARHRAEHPTDAARAKLHLATGRSYEAAQQWVDATAAFRKALELDPLSLELIQAHARAHRMQRAVG